MKPTNNSLSFSKMNVFISYNRFVMIELVCLNELMLIRQVNQKTVTFVAIGIFKIKGLSFNRMFAMSVMTY